MKISSGQYSIVIINPAITPLAASSFRDWEKLGKLTNKILVPPLFQAEIGTQINIKVFEGKAELLFKSIELDAEFQKILEIAQALFSAFNAFETKAVGVNLNGLWLESNFDFEEWREKVFKFDFKNNPVENSKQILTTEFKISLKNKGFFRNITFSENDESGEKGLRVNVNNHFDLNVDNTFKSYQNVIDQASKILKETQSEIENQWLAG